MNLDLLLQLWYYVAALAALVVGIFLLILLAKLIWTLWDHLTP